MEHGTKNKVILVRAIVVISEGDVEAIMHCDFLLLLIILCGICHQQITLS